MSVSPQDSTSSVASVKYLTELGFIVLGELGSLHWGWAWMSHWVCEKQEEREALMSADLQRSAWVLCLCVSCV